MEEIKHSDKKTNDSEQLVYKKYLGNEPTLCTVKTREARGRICVCERWDSTLVQTTRTNQMMPESVMVGVVFIIKKGRFLNALLLSV